MIIIKGPKSFPNNFLFSQYLCKVYKGSKGKGSNIASSYFTFMHAKQKKDTVDRNQKHIF